MADAFATPAELNIFTGRSIDEDQATMMLAQASAAIRSHCGWHIAPEEEAEWSLDGSGSVLLFLPSLYVVSVESVTDDDEELTEEDDYQWSGAGFMRRVGAYWTSALRGVVVELTHGYDTVPDEIKSVCLQAAARAVASPAGVKSEQTGGLSVTYAIPGGLTNYEEAVLERHRVAGAA